MLVWGKEITSLIWQILLVLHIISRNPHNLAMKILSSLFSERLNNIFRFPQRVNSRAGLPVNKTHVLPLKE